MARVNRTTGFFLVLGVMTLVGTVAGFGFMQQPAADSQQTSGPNENSVFAQGNVDVASGLAPLVPRMPGKVAAILVKEGDAVQKGQTLVQLDDQQQREELKIAEQGLQVSRAKLKGAKDAADKKAVRGQIRELHQKLTDEVKAVLTPDQVARLQLTASPQRAAR